MTHKITTYDPITKAGMCRKCGDVTVWMRKKSDGSFLPVCTVAKSEQRNRKYRYFMADGRSVYLSKSERSEIIKKFDSRCAICKCTEGRLVLDHCHLTGKWRGLLCDDCNHGLGKFKDSVENLQGAIDYLKSNIMLDTKVRSW
jgi:hypothetical protein